MPDFSQAAWRKSSESKRGDCVEVAGVPGHVGIRDTKDRFGPQLTVPEASWADFLAAVRAGGFPR